MMPRMGRAYMNRSRNHNKWYLALPYTTCVYCVYGSFDLGKHMYHIYEPNSMDVIHRARFDHGYTDIGDVYIPGTVILKDHEMYVVDAINVAAPGSLHYIMKNAQTGKQMSTNSNFFDDVEYVQAPFRSSFLTLYPGLRAWYEWWTLYLGSKGYTVNPLDI